MLFSFSQFLIQFGLTLFLLFIYLQRIHWLNPTDNQYSGKLNWSCNLVIILWPVNWVILWTRQWYIKLYRSTHEKNPSSNTSFLHPKLLYLLLQRQSSWAFKFRVQFIKSLKTLFRFYHVFIGGFIGLHSYKEKTYWELCAEVCGNKSSPDVWEAYHHNSHFRLFKKCISYQGKYFSPIVNY